MFCCCFSFFFRSWNLPPHFQNTALGWLYGLAGFVGDLVLLILLSNQLLPVFWWAFFFKYSAPSPSLNHTTVVLCRFWCVLCLNIVLFSLVHKEEIEEALVASNLDTAQLVGVPALGEDLLYVTLVHVEVISVKLSAVWAEKRAKKDIAMWWPVLLAIYTEWIESILS